MGSHSSKYQVFERRFPVAMRQYRDMYGYSAKSLARAVGIDHRTVESHLAGQIPKVEHFFRYIDHFGSDFLNESLEPYGLGGVRRMEAEEICSYKIMASSCEAAQRLARAKSPDSPGGGSITPKEWGDIKRTLSALNSLITKATSGGVK